VDYYQDKPPVFITFFSDDQVQESLLVAIYSTVENTRFPNRLVFLIFTSPGFKEQLKRTLACYFDQHPKRFFTISIVELDTTFVTNRLSQWLLRSERLASSFNLARFYIDQLVPHNVKKVLFVDPDVVVQGDITELFDTALQDGTQRIVAAVAKRGGLALYLNFNVSYVAQNFDPKTQVFNAGVMVLDIEGWRRNNISRQLEHWLELNYHLHIFNLVTNPPLVLTFRDRWEPLDPLWNVDGLGWKVPEGRYAAFGELVRTKAKLLHWSGPKKPWAEGGIPAYVPLWTRYYKPHCFFNHTINKQQNQ
jgi:lipopolysaccharide biosynthesis glycosyltransferase